MTAWLTAALLIVSSAPPRAAAAETPPERTEYLKSCEGWLSAIEAGNPAQFLIDQPSNEAERVQLLTDLGLIRSQSFEGALRLLLAEREVDPTRLTERLRRLSRIGATEAERSEWFEAFVRHLRHVAAADASVSAARVRTKWFTDFLETVQNSAHASDYREAVLGEIQKSLNRTILRLALSRREHWAGTTAFGGLGAGFVTAFVLWFGRFPAGFGWSRLFEPPLRDFHLVHNAFVCVASVPVSMFGSALVLLPFIQFVNKRATANTAAAQARPISAGLCLIESKAPANPGPISIKALTDRDPAALNPVEIAYLGHVDLRALDDELARSLPGTLSTVGHLLAEIERRADVLVSAPSSHRARVEFAGAINEFSALNAGLETQWRETAEKLAVDVETLRDASLALRRRQYEGRTQDLTEARILKTEMILGKLDTDLATLATARIDPDRMERVITQLKTQLERARAVLDPLPASNEEWIRAAEDARVFVDQTRLDLQE